MSDNHSLDAPTDQVAVRHDLVDVVPYGAPQLDVPVRLNTNETAEPPPEAFLEEVSQQLGGLSLNRYPDRDHIALREALAARHETTTSRVWAANGSNEILQQLLQAYGGPGRTAMFVRPGYSMYPELCRTTLTQPVEIDLDDEFQLTPKLAQQAVTDHDPDLMVIPSPNNPVGTTVAHEALRALHDHSRALLVVDEAYIEFANSELSVRSLLEELPRLVMVRTLSKAFRLAGLRLGYLVGPEWVVSDVQKVRLPYHLDAIKQVAGVIAVAQEATFLGHRARVASERDRVAVALQGLRGVEVFDSAANFLLCRTSEAQLFDRLLERGVLVRDFSTKPRLEGCIRVTIGTESENDAFVSAMSAILSTG